MNSARRCSIIGLDPYYLLRAANSERFLRLNGSSGDEVELTLVPDRDRASVFCSHLVDAVRTEAELITGKRFRIVLAPCAVHGHSPALEMTR